MSYFTIKMTTCSIYERATDSFVRNKLLSESPYTIETAFVSDFGDKADFYIQSVYVFIEIKDIGFDGKGIPHANRRPHADIAHAIEIPIEGTHGD